MNPHVVDQAGEEAGRVHVFSTVDVQTAKTITEAPRLSFLNAVCLLQNMTVRYVYDSDVLLYSFKKVTNSGKKDSNVGYLSRLLS